MDIKEIRRDNLKALLAREFKGVRGEQSRLADMIGKPQNLISRLLADPSKPGAKNIGEDLARDIEKAFKLARYSLDAPKGIDRQELMTAPGGHSVAETPRAYGPEPLNPYDDFKPSPGFYHLLEKITGLEDEDLFMLADLAERLKTGKAKQQRKA